MKNLIKMISPMLMAAICYLGSPAGQIQGELNNPPRYKLYPPKAWLTDTPHIFSGTV